MSAYFTAAKKINISEIRKILEKSLPQYMIPSYYIQLEELPFTPNGKIDRKKLPEPKYNNLQNNIILPRNSTDKILIDIFKEVLNLETISINDSFFDLGGDSLLAINLSLIIQNKLNIKISVKEIIENPIIKDLSDIINNSNIENNEKIITRVPEKDFYKTSSAQKRIYYSSIIAGNDSLVYNTPGGIIFNGKIDYSKLEKCLNLLINRHEAFRTYFEIIDNELIQKINKNISFKLEIIKNRNYNELNKLFKKFVKPFDLSKAPLIRAKIVSFTNNKSIVSFGLDEPSNEKYSL